jgi:hypothetical protein
LVSSVNPELHQIGPRSQIPTFETRSDGRDNFVGALILAGNYNIPEVTVFFRLLFLFWKLYIFS